MSHNHNTQNSSTRKTDPQYTRIKTNYFRKLKVLSGPNQENDKTAWQDDMSPEACLETSSISPILSAHIKSSEPSELSLQTSKASTSINVTITTCKPNPSQASAPIHIPATKSAARRKASQEIELTRDSVSVDGNSSHADVIGTRPLSFSQKHRTQFLSTNTTKLPLIAENEGSVPKEDSSPPSSFVDRLIKDSENLAFSFSPSS